MSYISLEAELEELRRLGEIRDTPPLPADYDPFSGSVDPFPVDRSLFKEGAEIAEALVAGTEIGEEIIDFSKPMLMERSCPNLPCDYCDGLWLADHPNCETKPCAECIENGADPVED